MQHTATHCNTLQHTAAQKEPWLQRGFRECDLFLSLIGAGFWDWFLKNEEKKNVSLKSIERASGTVAVYIGLFSVYVRLFSVYVGLFSVYVGLFSVYVGLFSVYVGLFSVYVGLFSVYVGLFW